jgi:hypothetical protein
MGGIEFTAATLTRRQAACSYPEEEMDGNEPPALADAMPRRFRPEEDMDGNEPPALADAMPRRFPSISDEISFSLWSKKPL